MLTIAVCDDNAQFAKILAQKLRSLCAYTLPEQAECRIAPIFSSGAQVLEYIKEHTVNILFLDIDMPGMSGFELAEKLRAFSPDTVIIFVSAYEEFVYSSFEYCPFRFLRKTHLSQELPSTFRKAIEKCLIDKEIITLDTVDGEVILRLKEIIFFEGQKNYYIAHTESGADYKCRGTMDSVEKLLAERDFFRVHAAFIVNEEHIENIDNSGFIVMKNKKAISVSKRRMSAFKDSYMKFLRRRLLQNEYD